MQRLVLVVPLLAVGCARAHDPAPAPTPTPTPAVIYGEQARQERAEHLPAAGTAPPTNEVNSVIDSIWNVPLHTLAGAPTTLASFKGKALLIVNVASKCGNTPQYSTLEALQEKYAARGFSVVGFPCNQFGGQEPGSPEQIQTFCSTTYGVTFPMMEKTDVNGAKRSPVYAALTTVPEVGGRAGDIRWNFEKFVISADGRTITRFDPKTKPDDPAVIAAVEAALPTK